MRSRVLLLVLVGTTAPLILPLAAHAAGIPFFGPIIPNSSNLCPLGWNALVVVVNNVIALLLTLAIVFIAPIMIAYAGFLFVFNSVNPSGISKARSVLWNTVVGIVIALAAWMIVDAVMAALYNSTTPVSDGSVLQTWSNIIHSDGSSLCIVQASSLQTLNQAPITGISSLGSYSSGGSCVAPSSGVCAPANLQNTCFGSAANQAGIICAHESSGNPTNLSGTDITANGHPYSIGLFQINITNSFTQQVDGQSCASAFSQPCQNSGGYNNVQPSGACSSTVQNLTLYNDCVAAAENSANNISQACTLSNNGTNWSPWRNTAAACGL